jgi:hypothetical protein
VSAKSIRESFMPWAGLALGTAGYFIGHQLGSDSTFQDCRVGSPLMVTIAMLVALGMIGLGAFGSFGVFRTDSEGPSRRLIAAVSLLACALFAIAIILPFIASLIIPRCWA